MKRRLANDEGFDRTAREFTAIAEKADAALGIPKDTIDFEILRFS